MTAMVLTIAMWIGAYDNRAGFVPSHLYATLSQPLPVDTCRGTAAAVKLSAEWRQLTVICVPNSIAAAALFSRFHCEVTAMPEGSAFSAVAECPSLY